MPTTGRQEGGRGCSSRAAAMKAGSVPEAVELMGNSDLMSFAAVTEHGARLSRAYKQRKRRKLKKTTQTKHKITKARTRSKRKRRKA